MIARTSIGDIQYSFTHYRYDKPIKMGAVTVKAQTLCTMKVRDQIRAAGLSCSIEDNFNKEKGRKIALARVMTKTYNLSREVRREVWDSYWFRGHTSSGN